MKDSFDKSPLRQRMERRIRKQRAALRDNWEIVRHQWWFHHARPLMTKYHEVIMRLHRQRKDLENEIARLRDIEEKMIILRDGLRKIASMRRDQTSFCDTAGFYLRKADEVKVSAYIPVSDIVFTLPSFQTKEELVSYLNRIFEEDNRQAVTLRAEDINKLL